MAFRQCFVPTCLNDSSNSPDKVFVRIREDLREKWCRQANVEYLKICLMFCCEDHFNPHEDLKNYYKHKLMNQEPALKPTAVLNIFEVNQVNKVNEVNQCLGDNSELKKLLLLSPNQQTSTGRKRKYDDIDMPNQDAVEDDTADAIEINLENNEDQHDDVEFIDEFQFKKDPETLKHSDIECNVCRGEIVGFRYVCVQCVDSDMCASCEARGEHAAHYVLRLPAPKPYAECEPVIAAIREQIEHLLLLRTEIKSEACFEEEIKIEDSHTFDPNQTDPFSATTERNVPEIDICKKDSDTVADVEDNIPDLNTDPETDRPQTAPKLILIKSTDLIDRPQSPPICVLTKSTSLAPWVDKHVPVIKISKKQIVHKLMVKKTTDFKDRPQTAPKMIPTKCTVLAPKVLKISKKLSETVPKIKAVFPELNTHPEPDRPQISPKVIPTKSTECSSEVRVVAYKSVPGGPIKRILIGNSRKAKKAKESWNNK